MPVGVTKSVRLSEDVNGTLRGDVQIDPSARNLLVQAPAVGNPGGGNPGIYSWQMRPGGAQAYSIPAANFGVAAAPQGLLALPGGGAGATFTPIPFQKELFDTDGVDDTTPEIIDAASGLMTVYVPGYWRAGLMMHLGDPTGLISSYSAGVIWQVAVQARASSLTPGVFTTVASVCDITASLTATPALGKFPFVFGPSRGCSGIWNMDRGDTFRFAARAFATAYQAAPNASDAFPWTYTAWAYLAKPI